MSSLPSTLAVKVIAYHRVRTLRADFHLSLVSHETFLVAMSSNQCCHNHSLHSSNEHVLAAARCRRRSKSARLHAGQQCAGRGSNVGDENIRIGPLGLLLRVDDVFAIFRPNGFELRLSAACVVMCFTSRMSMS